MRALRGLLGLLVIIASMGSPFAHAQKACLGPSTAMPRRALPGKNALAPDIQSKALWDGRNSVDFRALDFPKMVSAERADFLADDEYVLGLTVNGESRAYPTRFLAWHHIINDKMGKPEAGGEAFVTVTY